GPERRLTWASGSKAKRTSEASHATARPEVGMSFREITMQDIREVLRRVQAGQSARQIARETGLDRKTVGRYLAQARLQGVQDAEVTEEVAGAVGKQVQTRPLPAPSEQWLALQAQRLRIKTWLDGEKPLRLVRVHELLAREGLEVGYTTLRRFA